MSIPTIDREKDAQENAEIVRIITEWMKKRGISFESKVHIPSILMYERELAIKFLASGGYYLCEKCMEISYKGGVAIKEINISLSDSVKIKEGLK